MLNIDHDRCTDNHNVTTNNSTTNNSTTTILTAQPNDVDPTFSALLKNWVDGLSHSQSFGSESNANWALPLQTMTKHYGCQHLGRKGMHKQFSNLFDVTTLHFTTPQQRQLHDKINFEEKFEWKFVELQTFLVALWPPQPPHPWAVVCKVT